MTQTKEPCRYCGQEYRTNRGGLTRHERKCKQNPENMAAAPTGESDGSTKPEAMARGLQATTGSIPDAATPSLLGAEGGEPNPNGSPPGGARQCDWMLWTNLRRAARFMKEELDQDVTEELREIAGADVLGEDGPWQLAHIHVDRWKALAEWWRNAERLKTETQTEDKPDENTDDGVCPSSAGEGTTPEPEKELAEPSRVFEASPSPTQDEGRDANHTREVASLVAEENEARLLERIHVLQARVSELEPLQHPTELVVHPSSADRGLECVESLRPGLWIQSDSQPGRLGTVYHHAMAHVVECRLECPPTYDEIAGLTPDEITDVEPKDVWYLVRDTIPMWSTLSRYFPEGSCEVEKKREFKIDVPPRDPELPLGGAVHIRMTADLRAMLGRRVLVVDWKSSMHFKDHSEQVRWYGWGALQDYPEARSVVVYVAHARHGKLEGEEYTREELEAWAKKRARYYLTASGFNPGDHCEWCPRLSACPMLREQVADWVSLLVDDESVEAFKSAPDEITDAQLNFALHRAKLVDYKIRDFRQWLRGLVEKRGSVEASEITEWRLVSNKARPIDPVKGWPVLTRYFSPEDFGKFLSLRKDPLSKCLTAAVNAKASKRNERASLKKQFWAELEETGAITEVDATPRLLEVKKETSDAG